MEAVGFGAMGAPPHKKRKNGKAQKNLADMRVKPGESGGQKTGNPVREKPSGHEKFKIYGGTKLVIMGRI